MEPPNKDKDQEMMIRMKDYSYTLQESSIAKYPASPRGSSKVCRVDGRGRVQFLDHFAHHFPSLARGCHLVLNDSLVLDARLFVDHPNLPTNTTTTSDTTTTTTITDSPKIELMILDLGEVHLQAPCEKATLRAMIRISELTPNQRLRDAKSRTEIRVDAIKGIWEEEEESDGNGLDCMVTILSKLSLAEYLDQFGSVPIPPYFQRPAEPCDREAYNNVYAATVGESGSVAAPTAGLHFTQSLLHDKIGKDNLSFLTLHVGAGTFQPVLKENAAQHDMHAESFAVPLPELERIVAILASQKPLIVVGTTSCRTLESLYWCGVKLLGQNTNGNSTTNGNNKNGNHQPTILELDQFEWKELESHAADISNQKAFQALMEHYKKENSEVIHGRTRLMITPVGYQFRVVEHLVTNFHAPDSTLMLLVCAFLGSAATIQNVYHQAQDQGYRFLSYGDVCLFSRPGCVLPVDRP